MERIILEASDGMILTNGKIYGRTIYLAGGIEPTDFYEISEDAYYTLTQEEEEDETV